VLKHTRIRTDRVREALVLRGVLRGRSQGPLAFRNHCLTALQVQQRLRSVSMERGEIH
jgi:hypothetical protein